jgi:hypothetical protein|tara:strand:- start:755 stop:991 length:237 start_codon:yes stop_codon:yes gene_type:complete
MNITKLEEAVLNAQEVAAGFAAMQLVKDLLEKGEAASAIVTDSRVDSEARKQALKDSRHVNATLNFIAAQRAMIGIDA